MKNPWRELSKVNPQKENGHREINNDIYHALMAAKLPGAVYQIVFTVIDKTWGFAKQEAPISLSQFESLTSLSHQSVRLAVKQAEGIRLIVVNRVSTKVSEYMFNKHYDTWLIGRKPNHPRLGNQITLDLETKSPKSRKLNHPSTRKPATLRTVPVKKGIKETIKETIKESGQLNNVLLFEDFWMLYPKKVAKKDAEKAFRKIKLTEELSETITDALKRAKNTTDWLKDNGQFIPNPATWLNGKRWEDEIREGEKNGSQKRGPRGFPDRTGYTRPAINPRLEKLVDKERESRQGAGGESG